MAGDAIAAGRLKQAVRHFAASTPSSQQSPAAMDIAMLSQGNVDCANTLAAWPKASQKARKSTATVRALGTDPDYSDGAARITWKVPLPEWNSRRSLASFTFARASSVTSLRLPARPAIANSKSGW